MITSKKMLREYLAADAAANKKPPIARYPLVCRLAGWYNMLYINYMRRCEYIDGTRGPGFFGSLVERYYWHKLKRVSLLTGFQISPNTCGKGLYLPHWGSILVNGNARLGERCVIQSGVLVAEGVRGGDQGPAWRRDEQVHPVPAGASVRHLHLVRKTGKGHGLLGQGVLNRIFGCTDGSRKGSYRQAYLKMDPGCLSRCRLGHPVCLKERERSFPFTEAHRMDAFFTGRLRKTILYSLHKELYRSILWGDA